MAKKMPKNKNAQELEVLDFSNDSWSWKGKAPVYPITAEGYTFDVDNENGLDRKAISIGLIGMIIIVFNAKSERIKEAEILPVFFDVIGTRSWLTVTVKEANDLAKAAIGKISAGEANDVFDLASYAPLEIKRSLLRSLFGVSRLKLNPEFRTEADRRIVEDIVPGIFENPDFELALLTGLIIREKEEPEVTPVYPVHEEVAPVAVSEPESDIVSQVQNAEIDQDAEAALRERMEQLTKAVPNLPPRPVEKEEDAYVPFSDMEAELPSDGPVTDPHDDGFGFSSTEYRRSHSQSYNEYAQPPISGAASVPTSQPVSGYPRMTDPHAPSFASPAPQVPPFPGAMPGQPLPPQPVSAYPRVTDPHDPYFAGPVPQVPPFSGAMPAQPVPTQPVSGYPRVTDPHEPSFAGSVPQVPPFPGTMPGLPVPPQPMSGYPRVTDPHDPSFAGQAPQVPPFPGAMPAQPLPSQPMSGYPRATDPHDPSFAGQAPQMPPYNPYGQPAPYGAQPNVPGFNMPSGVQGPSFAQPGAVPPIPPQQPTGAPQGYIGDPHDQLFAQQRMKQGQMPPYMGMPPVTDPHDPSFKGQVPPLNDGNGGADIESTAPRKAV